MKTDITIESIKSHTNPDELAELALVLQGQLNAAKDWISDAKRKVGGGGDYAPRDVFRAKEKEQRDIGAMMNIVNERRGALRRLAAAEAQAKERGRATAKLALTPDESLLSIAIELLFELYNDSYEDRFVEMLHEEDCLRDATCTCPHAKTFDQLMIAGGLAARATEPILE